jgi:hypothetical protein
VESISDCPQRSFMTPDTDGKRALLAILMPLKASVARLAALCGWRRRDLEGESDELDDVDDSTRMTPRKLRVIAVLAMLLAGGGLWLLLSNGRPGSQPSNASRSPHPAARLTAHNHPGGPGGIIPPIPDSYHVLLTRSIFAEKGATGSHDAALATAKLTLKGISQEDNRFTAYVEAAGHMLELHVGETLAAGYIRRITLHSIEYEADGRLTRVEVGQPFDAGAIVAGDSPASESAEGSTPAPDAKHAPDHPRESPLFAGEPTR